jgi:hypothetical protein
MGHHRHGLPRRPARAQDTVARAVAVDRLDPLGRTLVLQLAAHVQHWGMYASPAASTLATDTRQIPLQPWLIGFLKVFYDREISVSEQSVKVSSILHNHSLIMGRQIINILPEGFVNFPPSLAANTDQSLALPFSTSSTHHSV